LCRRLFCIDLYGNFGKFGPILIILFIFAFSDEQGKKKKQSPPSNLKSVAKLREI